MAENEKKRGGCLNLYKIGATFSRFLSFIFRKLSILLAVGFSDVSTKTIVYLNDEKGACFSNANPICFFPWQISEGLKERLLEFHRKAGLGFGAYDFLERGDDVIFLECNPGGAWLWLEQSLGLKVSEQVAKCLLGINETKSS